jgi:hypothetical protein
MNFGAGALVVECAVEGVALIADFAAGPNFLARAYVSIRSRRFELRPTQLRLQLQCETRPSPVCMFHSNFNLFLLAFCLL